MKMSKSVLQKIAELESKIVDLAGWKALPLRASNAYVYWNDLLSTLEKLQEAKNK